MLIFITCLPTLYSIINKKRQEFGVSQTYISTSTRRFIKKMFGFHHYQEIKCTDGQTGYGLNSVIRALTRFTDPTHTPEIKF